MGVLVLTTGGTIARESNANVDQPLASGGELLAGLAHEPDIADCQVEDLVSVDSHVLSVRTMYGIAMAVRKAVIDGAFDGVVVAHGTDTVEETLWLAHLVAAAASQDTPIVFTAAMRYSGDVGYDGLRNILDAVRVAQSPRSQGRGAMLCMNSEIHAAQVVTKLRTDGLGAFGSPGIGPIGRVVLGEPTYWAARDAFAKPEVKSEINERVAIVASRGGYFSETVDHLVAQGVKGLVVEGVGGGNVPPDCTPTIVRALETDVRVVLTTRVPVGPFTLAFRAPGSASSLVELGAISCGSLSSTKARLALMIALGKGNDRSVAESLFRQLTLADW